MSLLKASCYFVTYDVTSQYHAFAVCELHIHRAFQCVGDCDNVCLLIQGKSLSRVMELEDLAAIFFSERCFGRD